jgi:hypothetical protein
LSKNAPRSWPGRRRGNSSSRVCSRSASSDDRSTWKPTNVRGAAQTAQHALGNSTSRPSMMRRASQEASGSAIWTNSSSRSGASHVVRESPAVQGIGHAFRRAASWSKTRTSLTETAGGGSTSRSREVQASPRSANWAVTRSFVKLAVLAALAAPAGSRQTAGAHASISRGRAIACQLSAASAWSMNASMSLAGRAPTVRAFSWPRWNTAIIGMD